MTTYRVWNGTSWEYIDNQNYDARYLLRSELGAAEGTSSLDSSGHIPTEQLPSSITGAVSYQGTFDPTSGSPTPAAQGYYYVSDGVGTIDTTSFATGDWLVYRDDTTWDKIANSSASITWSNISDKPAGYTPESHGNEAHDVVYAVTSDITYETLNTNGDVGVSAGQLAIGNHTHSDLQPIDGDLTAIAALSGSAGLLRKTASNTWTLDTNTYITSLTKAPDSTLWDGTALPSFTDNELKYIRLNAGGDALEFSSVSIAINATQWDGVARPVLTDNALKYLRVNTDASALEFATVSGGDGTWGSITGTISDQTDLYSEFATVDDSRFTDARTPTAHNLIDTTGHSVSGLTIGHFLKATGATTYAFGAHGLTASDVGAQPVDDELTSLAGLSLTGNGGKVISVKSDVSGFELTTPATGGDITSDGNWVAAGDLIVGTGENTAAILTKGTEGQVLKVGSSTLEWGAETTYSLPTAASDTLGGVKIGTGISIAAGVITPDINGLTLLDEAPADGDYFAIYDTSGTALKKVAASNVGGSSGGGITWNEVTGTTQAAAVDNGYICNNAALVTVTLPSTCALGKTIRVAGKGAGGWKIAQNASQQIHFGDQSTTSGTGGSISSGYKYDAIELICITADTTFLVISAVGTMDVV